MSEILKPPKISEDGDATFEETCSVSDIVRYAISCSDINTVKYILDKIEKG